MSNPEIDGDTQDTTTVREELAGPPARALVRLTETRPDGRRLTRYRRHPDQA